MRLLKTQNAHRSLMVGYDLQEQTLHFIIRESGVGAIVGDIHDDQRLSETLDSLSKWLAHEADRLLKRATSTDK